MPSVFKRVVSELWGAAPQSVRYCESSGEVTSAHFSDEAAHRAAQRAAYFTRQHI